jgi:acid phosphatase family membrane protein YuiD
VFFASLSAWFFAQTLKIIYVLIVDKKLNFRRFVGSGGMPSSHSALVTGLAVSVGRYYGWEHPITGIALVFALIVMYDAAGVRRAVGRQAEVLNKILDEVQHKRTINEERLRELIGHTPIEVITGGIVGALIAIVLV